MELFGVVHSLLLVLLASLPAWVLKLIVAYPLLPEVFELFEGWPYLPVALPVVISLILLHKFPPFLRLLELKGKLVLLGLLGKLSFGHILIEFINILNSELEFGTHVNIVFWSLIEYAK